MKKILIIQTGTTHPEIISEEGDFAQLMIRAIGVDQNQFKIIKPYEDDDYPSSESISGIIITGSHSMVTEKKSWMLNACEKIRGYQKHEIPIFGVCFGHQLLNIALGGEVNFHPRGIELGLSTIRYQNTKENNSLIFQNVPNFSFNSHKQSITRLAPGATILAKNDFDDHQAVQYDQNTWSVQFHPEFTLKTISNYIERHKSEVTNLKEILVNLKEIENNGFVLKNFYRYCAKNIKADH